MHTCPECDFPCHCGGDIDDCQFDGTPAQTNCKHCDGEREPNDDDQTEIEDNRQAALPIKRYDQIQSNESETQATLALATGSPSGIELEVCNDISSRQAAGIKKYGMTVADNPLPLKAWLQHAYEETIDQAIYLKRAIREMENERAETLQIGGYKSVTLLASEHSNLAEYLGQLEHERDDMLAFIREQVELWDNDGDSGFPLYEHGKRILSGYPSPNERAEP